jgi:hypothetical protein
VQVSPVCGVRWWVAYMLLCQVWQGWLPYLCDGFGVLLQGGAEQGLGAPLGLNTTTPQRLHTQ